MIGFSYYAFCNRSLHPVGAGGKLSSCRVKLTIYFKLFGENGEIATFSGLKVSSKCGQTRIPRVKLAVD